MERCQNGQGGEKVTTIMKRLFIFIVILLIGPAIYAQAERVTRLEGEFYVGATCPLSDFHSGTKKVGSALGAELRYNFNDSPFDIGFTCFLTTSVYGFEDDDVQVNRPGVVAFLSDYNFKQGGKVNPYVGLGVGISSNDVLNDKIFDDEESCSLAFVPRIGVEFIHRLRLTLSSNITKKGYHNLSLTVGFVIGGSKKE